MSSQQEVEQWLSRENARIPTCLVSEPEFHKGGMLSKSYLDFKFTTTIPGGATFETRHRFSEVEGIRAKIKDIFMPLGIFVPCTPTKGITQNNADINNTFVKERIRGLNLFVNHMFSNPFIANEKSWLEFMGGNGDNAQGLTMLRSALDLTEQPFKFTIVQRIDAIKDEVAVIETAMKSQLTNLRNIVTQEKSLKTAYDQLHGSMAYFSQGESISVKCLNGFPFDTTESIINPSELHVQHSITAYDNLCLASGVCGEGAAPDEVMSCVLIPAIEHELNSMYAFREMLKVHEDMMIAHGSIILKLEKEQMSQNQARIEDYKRRQGIAELDRSLFYKGFIYFTLMMYARYRGPLLREAYSGIAAVKLAEASQTHTASKEFFKYIKMHPNNAAEHANKILRDLGLAPLNTKQMDLSGEDFPQTEVTDIPLAHGLFDAAISGNYGPLQSSAPPIPPASFGAVGEGFSDNEGDEVDFVAAGLGATDLQAGGGTSI
jgi:hypothetical protein